MRLTKVQFLLKDAESGRSYARLFFNGKEVWRSLKTDVFSVAQARLAILVKDSRFCTKASQTVETGKATVETTAGVYLERVRQSVNLKASTVDYREQLVSAILRHGRNWLFTGRRINQKPIARTGPVDMRTGLQSNEV